MNKGKGKKTSLPPPTRGRKDSEKQRTSPKSDETASISGGEEEAARLIEATKTRTLTQDKGQRTKDDTGEVLSVKRGPREELQLHVSADKCVEDLKTAIGDKIEGVVVREAARRVPGVVFQVKDWRDLEATLEEVKEGFRSVIGEEVVRVGQLRPAYGGTQCATVLVPGIAARKLTGVTRIQIGWVSCRLIRREEETRCYRCWEMGHTSGNCKGEDRRNKCFNCGQDGHYWANCTQVRKCLGCGSEDHRTGAFRCHKK